jgi:predicted transcriptional regulator
LTVTADGARLAGLLRQRALTRAELAQEARISVNTVTRMLRGESIRVSTYRRVVEVLERHPRQRLLSKAA